jgi:hypothetical protein
MSVSFLLFRFCPPRGRRLLWRLPVALILCLGAAARPAAAGQVDGDSGQGGVTITIVRWDGQDRIHAQGAGADDGCDYGLAVGPPGFVPDLDTIGPRPPDSNLAVLTCNGTAVRLVWVGPHNTVDLADAARVAAQRWVETIPVPSPTVGASPPDAGLVGVESWFWINDGPGGPITDRVEAFGVGVDVRMVPSPVSWSFGDGTSTVGGAGHPWPTRSNIRHSYQHGGTLTVMAAQRLEPAYRVAGTDWLALPAFSLDATLGHRVHEAQALLTS